MLYIIFTCIILLVAIGLSLTPSTRIDVDWSDMVVINGHLKYADGLRRRKTNIKMGIQYRVNDLYNNPPTVIDTKVEHGRWWAVVQPRGETFRQWVKVEDLLNGV